MFNLLFCVLYSSTKKGYTVYTIRKVQHGELALKHDKDIIQYCEEIHRSFKPAGSYNVQLIKKKNNSISSFEINPRISTTFSMGIFAGFDPFLSYNKANVRDYRLHTVPDIYLKRYWNTQIFKDKK